MTGHDDELLEEHRKVRLLRISTDLLIQIFMQSSPPAAEADNMIRGLRRFALKLFPGKGAVFDLIYLPRFRRALEEAGVRDLPNIPEPPEAERPHTSD